MSKRTAAIIFSNLLDIISVNGELLRQLQERLEPMSTQTTDQQCVGDIFLALAPFLKVYSIYVKSFHRALACLESELKGNPALARCAQEQQAQHASKNLSLQAHLLGPVQRIPRYRLLLEDLLRYTLRDHPDYEQLQASLQLIAQVASFINEVVRQDEHAIELIRLQARLSGCPENLLATPGRRILKQGRVMKVSRKAHHVRVLICLTDCLLYTSPGLLDSQLLFHRKIPLYHCQVRAVADTRAIRHLMQVISPERSFACYVDSQSVRDAWVDVITGARRVLVEDMQSLRRGLQSTGSPLAPPRTDSLHGPRPNEQPLVELSPDLPSMPEAPDYLAPVWVPDALATHCSVCSTPFTLFHRRHHCRICGCIVCGACSRGSFTVAPEVLQPERACAPCIRMLRTSPAHAAHFRVFDEDVALGEGHLCEAAAVPRLLAGTTVLGIPLASLPPLILHAAWSLLFPVFPPDYGKTSTMTAMNSKTPKQHDVPVPATNHCRLCLVELGLWRWAYRCSCCGYHGT
jgi:hypothetical protein